jgi:hypothetical protein
MGVRLYLPPGEGLDDDEGLGGVQTAPRLVLRPQQAAGAADSCGGNLAYAGNCRAGRLRMRTTLAALLTTGGYRHYWYNH